MSLPMAASVDPVLAVTTVDTKSCMTLSSLNLGNYGTVVYESHVGFLVATLSPKPETL